MWHDLLIRKKVVKSLSEASNQFETIAKCHEAYQNACTTYYHPGSCSYHGTRADTGDPENFEYALLIVNNLDMNITRVAVQPIKNTMEQRVLRMTRLSRDAPKSLSCKSLSVAVLYC